ncbi:MAG: hypothetical protein H6816_04250 [Phycisphaerales bacterium]|nr:hypothetical protein [Phycisphaerales bacterium]
MHRVAHPRTWRFFPLAMSCACAALFVAPAVSLAQAEDTSAPSAVDRPEPSEELATLFNDFLHYARLGKFTEAEAYADKLLAYPDLDPVQVLRIADRDKQAVPTLITMISHTSLRDTAQKVLDLIREGEFQERQETGRIRSIKQTGRAAADGVQRDPAALKVGQKCTVPGPSRRNAEFRVTSSGRGHRRPTADPGNPVSPLGV